MYGAVQGANLAGAQADYLRGVTPALQLADNLTRTPTQVDQTGRHSYSGVYSPNNQTAVSNNIIPLTNPMGDYGQLSNNITNDQAYKDMMARRGFTAMPYIPYQNKG